ncbi:hypothetical protein SAMN04489742_0427 [Arthrobacter crystallopoietes]|uniref:Uncharacterized protein n=1 Tax=Crystallibacter crystallopoietes TaxID=37928 RepID=A0A1H0ZL78_9MICC|nr:hypothetical protein SAMN04489742_0427 [Arthrobacter crystallopoietes]
MAIRSTDVTVEQAAKRASPSAILRQNPVIAVGSTLTLTRTVGTQ